MVTLVGLVAVAGARGGKEIAAGEQQRLEATGWLQLQYDQRTYRERVDPLGSGDRVKLDRLEHRQRLEFDALRQRGRQSTHIERRRRRAAEAQRPAVRGRKLNYGRKLERQRLDMRIQREALRPGRP